MVDFIKNSSLFREARIFHLKLWQTPTFLFIMGGAFTLGMTVFAYSSARNSSNPFTFIVTVSGATIAAFIIGTLLAKVIGKIIIINQAKNEFLSLVTHQLRSPLTGTKYILELIMTGKAGNLTPTQHELLEEGFHSNERMLILVNDLLSMSRMAEGGTPFNLKPEHLDSLIKEVVKEIEPQAIGKKIKIELQEPPEKLPKVNIDASKIRFVIQNLVDNSVKYTPDGGRIKIIMKKNGLNFHFAVSDTGIGIPSDEVEKLFTKFFRASNAETSKKIGTGLGLYIVKNIIERHNGDIWVESIKDKGSTFSFKIPFKARSINT